MLYAVILAGGGGSRLWPLSRPHLPKQFLSLVGEHSLLQETILRLQDLVPPERIVIVTGNDQEPLVRSHLLQIPNFAAERVQIITEPAQKNTAAAIGLAALYLQRIDPDALMLVLPADHWINHRSEFTSLIKQSVKWAEQGALITFGIVPTRPETGYGYIQRGLPCELSASGSEAYHVAGFVEKPPLATAQYYFSTGTYYWNAGIFLWRAATILREIETFLPSLADGLREIRKSDERDNIAAVYSRLASVSIDYGVLEKVSGIVVIPMAIGWSDLGDWTAIHRLSPQDEQGNAVQGQVVLQDSENSFIYSYSRPIAGIGLRDLVVVETDSGVLVSTRERVQEVKSIGEYFPLQRTVYQDVSQLVHRPWGTYTISEEGPGYKVKRLEIQPGASISLQFHHYRNEHWVVVQGTACVTKDAEEIVLKTNESTYVPQGTLHRLANPGAELLEVIEVQTGAYLGEDDIVRVSPGREPAACESTHSTTADAGE